MIKADLEEYRSMVTEVGFMSYEIERLRSDGGMRNWPDGQPHGNHVTDHTGILASEVALLRAECDAMRLEMLQCRCSIEKAIRRLPYQEKQVIRLYYFLGLKWTDVALQMRYSLRWVMEIHNRAIQRMELYSQNQCAEDPSTE